MSTYTSYITLEDKSRITLEGLTRKEAITVQAVFARNLAQIGSVGYQKNFTEVELREFEELFGDE